MAIARVLLATTAAAFPLVAGAVDEVIRVPPKSVTSPSIEYFGHACIRIESLAGMKVLIDPYASGGFPPYSFPDGDLAADVLLVTHEHADHDFGGDELIQKRWGKRLVTLYDGEAVIGDVRVHGIAGRHARRDDGMRNVIWIVEVAGKRLVHLGDNEPVSEQLAERIGDVDVLFIPVDAGHHLLSDAEVEEIIGRLEPRVTVPVHYRILELEPELTDVGPDTDWNGFGPIDPWLATQINVVRQNDNAVAFADLSTLPDLSVLVFRWPVPEKPGPKDHK